MPSIPACRAIRVTALCAFAFILWTAGASATHPPGLCQAAAALDLDEPGGRGDAASAPLPPPRDDYAPVHGRPDFLSADEWAGVQAMARSAPDPAHETARLVDYLRFQKAYFKWSAERSSDPADARRLAERLVGDLPDKVAQGVVGAEQAEQTLAQLVAFLEPDPDRQQKRLAREIRRLPPQPSAPAAFTR